MLILLKSSDILLRINILILVDNIKILKQDIDKLVYIIKYDIRL